MASQRERAIITPRSASPKLEHRAFESSDKRRAWASAGALGWLVYT